MTDPSAPIALETALDRIRRALQPLPAEPVPVAEACGRVLAAAVTIGQGPRRAAIDGFAVRAADTEGASDYAPLPIAGALLVAGADLPDAADAVLPLHAAEAGMARLSLAPGDGVELSPATRLALGTRLSPRHLALLAASGPLPVRRRVRVSLRVAGAKSGPDTLTPMLQAWIARLGAATDGPPDLILAAGRSGPGPDDHGIDPFANIVFRHVAIRPGESTAFGQIDACPALLLPGEPFACAVSFALLAAPALRRLAGEAAPAPLRVELARKAVSALGLADAVPVRLDGALAVPLPPSLALAAGSDGLVLVPPWLEGYPVGAAVDLSLWP